MKNNFLPLGDRVLIKRTTPPEVSKGGIILPSNQEKPKEGEVIELGTGKLLENGERTKFTVSVGDMVVFTAYGGTEVKHEDNEFLIMREEDILGVVKK